METIEIERTKKGYPAMWEEGGGATHTGNSQIIAGRNGERLRPVYICGSGTLSNARHALFIVEPGFFVIKADHHREDFIIQVMRIVVFKVEEGKEVAFLEVISTYDRGEWDNELPSFLQDAVDVAKDKATYYHCREPLFLIKEEKVYRRY